MRTVLLAAARSDGAVAVAAALCAPLFFYVLNPNWAYTPPGWLDSFISVGIGLYYGDPEFAKHYYKISRLPWNLYQYVFRQLFEENTAQIALHASLTLASAVFGYVIGARLFGRTIALFLAVLVCCFPLTNLAGHRGGSDYQSALASPLLLAYVAAVARFDVTRIASTCFMAGAAMAALFSTNSMYGQMLPFMAMFGAVLVLDRGGRWRTVAMASVWTICGGVATLGVLGAINALVGRSFFFLLPEIRWVQLMLADSKANEWWYPFSLDQSLRSTHFGFLFGWAIVAMIECVRLLMGSGAFKNRVALTLHAWFIVMLAIWTIWQFYGQHTALEPRYFAQPLYVPACLSIAAVLHRCALPRGRIPFLILALAAPVAVFAMFVSYNYLTTPPPAGILPALAVGFAFLAAYLLIAFGPVRRPFFGILASGALLLATATLSNPLEYAPRTFAPTSCRLYPNLNKFMINNSVHLARQVARPTDVFVWAHPNDVQTVSRACRDLWRGLVSDVAHSFGSLGHSFLGQQWPKLLLPSEMPLEVLSALASRPVLVAVFASHDGVIKELEERFRSANVDVKASERIDSSDTSLPKLYVLRLVPSR